MGIWRHPRQYPKGEIISRLRAAFSPDEILTADDIVARSGLAKVIVHRNLGARTREFPNLGTRQAARYRRQSDA